MSKPQVAILVFLILAAAGLAAYAAYETVRIVRQPDPEFNWRRPPSDGQPEAMQIYLRELRKVAVATNAVTIQKGCEPVPQVAQVRRDDMLRLQNNDSLPHRLKFRWREIEIPAGEQGEFRISREERLGFLPYFCDDDPDWVGALLVDP